MYLSDSYGSFDWLSLLFCLALNAVLVVFMAFMIRSRKKKLTVRDAVISGLCLDLFLAFVTGILEFSHLDFIAARSTDIIWSFIWAGVITVMFTIKCTSPAKKKAVTAIILAVCGLLTVNYLAMCVYLLLIRYYYTKQTIGITLIVVMSVIAAICVLTSARWAVKETEKGL